MHCKEFDLKERANELHEDSNIDKIMAHAMPNYKTWENKNG